MSRGFVRRRFGIAAFLVMIVSVLLASACAGETGSQGEAGFRRGERVGRRCWLTGLGGR